jgi:hypothetical protein
MQLVISCVIVKVKMMGSCVMILISSRGNS